jgi:hypothetical protein
MEAKTTTTAQKLAALSARLHYLKSKTLLFFGGIGTALLQNADEVQAQLTAALPQLQPYLPENPFKTLGAVLIFGGIVLRFATNSPLSAKTPAAPADKA